MSWFDPAQHGHASAGSAASISATTPRISSASRLAWVSMNAKARSSWSPVAEVPDPLLHFERVGLAEEEPRRVVRLGERPPRRAGPRASPGGTSSSDVASRARGSPDRRAAPDPCTIACATSMRNPATPRSNQNRRIRSNSRATSGFHQLRSGCCAREVVQVVPPALVVERPCRAAAEDRLPVVRDLVRTRRRSRAARETTGAGRTSGSGRDRAAH